MKEYKPILRIPLEYVHGFSDEGFLRIKEDGLFPEDDDLRLVVSLAGGHSFLLMPGQRLYVDSGYLVIEDLQEV